MVLIQLQFILSGGKMERNQEKLYPHVPSLCNDCQNFNWDDCHKFITDWDEKGLNLVCGCHVLVEMLQEEAKNSKFQPSEKHNSERIDIESTKKSKSCVPKMFWLSLLTGCFCIFVLFICFSIFIIGMNIFSTNWTKTSVDDYGSKYR